MAYEEVDVEQVVRLVLARLQERARQPTAPSRAPALVAAQTNELVWLGGLVTEQELIRQLGDARVLRVATRTIVTPAACDFLKARGVIVQRVDRDQSGGDAARQTRVALGVAETKFEPSGVIRFLTKQGMKVEQCPRIGLPGVANELAERVAKGGDHGLLFTSQPFASICLLNRVRGVRAAHPQSIEEVRQAIREIGANQLVIDPAKQSQHNILQIVRTWCVAGPMSSPPGLNSHLQ